MEKGSQHSDDPYSTEKNQLITFFPPFKFSDPRSTKTGVNVKGLMEVIITPSLKELT